ncbi:MAG: glutamine--tRNA ligase/YqeY domain fusion protein [Lachnospiraceae bacterium]|nr:glutamine--tRNA ligase/YqeY domain fusion protein [Lachnospiraceae bacterium]MCI6977321.1 glutamine--tRNA ligase/YqeY domain fusion protein [Lachnospiraceae bacterium]MDY4429214.1 glutamine--tRNA ligase/YqeY domain fusion protein [Lachnospiraceae bacterium]MDY5216785.1 glutamine--tRNA ligase/YqeY domain fusion protein [Lachnospiraceae bacterium]
MGEENMNVNEASLEKEVVSRNFIEMIIDKDLEEGKYEEICTRFPPEPNGYLHIGHAKSILLNYGLAKQYNGKFNLRFDDTNPTKERIEFVDSIKADVEWLGADFEDRLFYASNYFDKIYESAVKLIKDGKAYVCDLTADEIKEYRGTFEIPGKESPYRNRSVEENLKLFTEMKDGKYADGEKVLRAKIDMASPNINMRDPVIYRVAHMNHHNTGDKWCIYPMYDFAHPLEDAFEGITHSICTLEFEDHRPLYDWVVENVGFEHPPKQIEFAKLYLTNVVTGKRYIKKLVEEGIVDGWDDPRLVSIAALRRRGFTPESIKMFVELCGVSKANSSVDYQMLEYCIREDLKLKKPRVMVCLDPIKVVVDNYPEDKVEWFDVPNNLENESLSTRKVPFCRELYIDREDFMEEPPKKYYRLYPGNEVRFMNAYFLTCTGVDKDENGNITLIHCTYDPETRNGNCETRKVKGTIHWVSRRHAIDATVRLYENLIDEEKGVYNEDGSLNLNPNSLTVLKNCKLEPSLKDAKAFDSFQFVRQGFFNVDYKDTKDGELVFNRIVSLKSSFKLNK